MDVASYVAGKICRWRFFLGGGEDDADCVTWVSGLPKEFAI